MGSGKLEDNEPFPAFSLTAVAIVSASGTIRFMKMVEIILLV